MAQLTPTHEPAPQTVRPSTLTTLTTYVITSGMLTCAVVGAVQLAWQIAPDWNAAHVPALAFLVALEAAYMTRFLNRPRVRDLPAPWYLLRAAEALVLFLMLRSLLGVQRGPGYEVQRDPFYGGIDNELFGLTLLLGLVWLSSWWLSRSLLDLETIDPTFDREIAKNVSLAQDEARHDLTRFVFVMGAALAFFAALLNIYLRTSQAAAPYGLWHVLIYFSLGLILVSRTRLFSLRAGWTWEHIPIGAGVGSRWLTYTALLLGIAFVIAVLLPTQYSLSLLSTLGTILSVLIALVQGFFYIIVFLLSLLLNLFRPDTPDRPAPPRPTPPPPVFPQAANGPTPTVSEFAQSLIFWAVFFVVAGYVLVQFLRRHPELIEILQNLPGMHLLARLWHNVRAWFGGLSQQFEDLREARRRARAANATRSASAPRRFINPRRLGPRQQVQFFYLAMLRRSGERGHPRTPTQTPQEFAASLRAQLPEVDADIAAITDEFSEARYSRHDIDATQAGRARRYWEQIKRALKR